jgi:hypothetical protein
MRGYYAGFNDCSGGGGGGSPGAGNRGVNWMQVCRDFDQFIAEPCGTLVTSETK